MTYVLCENKASFDRFVKSQFHSMRRDFIYISDYRKLMGTFNITVLVLGCAIKRDDYDEVSKMIQQRKEQDRILR